MKGSNGGKKWWPGRCVDRCKVPKGMKPLSVMQMALHVVFHATEPHLSRPLPWLVTGSCRDHWSHLASKGPHQPHPDCEEHSLTC